MDVYEPLPEIKSVLSHHFFLKLYRAPNLTFFSTNILYFRTNKEFDWFSSVCPNIQVLLIHSAVRGLETAHLTRFSKLEILDLYDAQFDSLLYIIPLLFIIK